MMDPNACLDRLLAAIRNGQTAEAVQAASDLLVWCLSGGFEPINHEEQRELIRLGLARCADRLEDPLATGIAMEVADRYRMGPSDPTVNGWTGELQEWLDEIRDVSLERGADHYDLNRVVDGAHERLLDATRAGRIPDWRPDPPPGPEVKRTV